MAQKIIRHHIDEQHESARQAGVDRDKIRSSAPADNTRARAVSTTKSAAQTESDRAQKALDRTTKAYTAITGVKPNLGTHYSAMMGHQPAADLVKVYGKAARSRQANENEKANIAKAIKRKQSGH